MWLLWSFLLVGIILLVIGLLGLKYNWEIVFFIVYGGLIIIICMILLPQQPKKIKESYAKELLITDNPYEMVIQYELQDSIYVPKDTVFYLKETNHE